VEKKFFAIFNYFSDKRKSYKMLQISYIQKKGTRKKISEIVKDIARPTQTAPTNSI